MRNMLVSPIYGWGRVEDQFEHALVKGQFENAINNTWVNIGCNSSHKSGAALLERRKDRQQYVLMGTTCLGY